MDILEKYPIPTGYLFVSQGLRGKLETLSIGDYGKAKNIKADFLGYTNKINGVPNGECLPLSEKWVVTLSTQYGCPMKCSFCDVPNIPFRGNVGYQDLGGQLANAISLFDVKYTERLNIHFARMGEPIFNDEVFHFSKMLSSLDGKLCIQNELGLRAEVIHPVLTTSCPRKYSQLGAKLVEWCHIKNDMFRGQAGLQLSINSTSDKQRDEMFNGQQVELERLSGIAKKFPPPVGRKYCLNFAYASNFEVDAKRLRDLFSPEKFMCKITPIHNNNACRKNGIETIGGYETYNAYELVEEDLKSVGFDVLVFVPSIDEEDGLVTCGNAVLGGGKLKNDCSIVRIQGQ